MKQKQKYRKPELEQYKMIWLTKEAYEYLRKEKKRQKKTMARILNNLILEGGKK